jgi:hypothetical protein
MSKPIMCALFVAAMFSAGAIAGMAQDVQEDGPGLQPSTIPGTDMAWPKDDKACDVAWKGSEYPKAIKVCGKALKEYKSVIAVLVATPNLKDGIVQDMVFNEGYTEMEIADSFSKTGDSKDSLWHAQQSSARAHSLLDPINAKTVRDETDFDEHTKRIARKLLDVVHAEFPSIAGGDGKFDT